jgi:TolB-like protein
VKIHLLAGSRLGVALLLASGAASAEPPARVALLPIVVHSNAPDSAYLSEGLADMLAARLEQTGGVSVIRVETNARTTKLPVAVEAARSAGADWVVFGSFTQFGSGASLDVRCARVAAEDGGGDDEGAARRVFIQSGSLGEIIPKLDALAGNLRRHVTGRATLASSEGGEPEAAPLGAQALDELRRRVDALERAVYEPPDTAATPPEPSGGAGG